MVEIECSEVTVEEKVISRSIFHFNLKVVYDETQKDLLSTESFDVVTDNKNLKLMWTIEQTYLDDSKKWKWNSIELKHSSKEVYGSFEIYSDENNIHETGTIDSNSLPFKQILEEVKISTNSYVFVAFEVHYEEEVPIINELLKDYNKLIENDKSSDVHFVVGKEVIPAHKAILSARNKVFEKMFSTALPERRIRKVDISDIEPSVFKLLLQFIYSGKIDCYEGEELLKVIVEADRYSMRGLVEVCESRIVETLETDKVIQILITADEIKADTLKEECLKFIGKNLDSIDSDKLNDLVRANRTGLVMEIIRTTENIEKN